VLDREVREGGHLVVHLSDGNRHRAARLAGGRCCDQEPALGGPKDRKLHRGAAMAALKASRVSLKKTVHAPAEFGRGAAGGWGSFETTKGPEADPC
jgi:hypothetical protein